MNSKMSEVQIKNASKKIKIILTDVDGVLTDGGLYYSKSGEVHKKFHVRDGMGVNILLRNGIKTIIITKEKSNIVSKWASEMNISKLFMGVKKKESLLPKICKLFSVKRNEVVYIGDDVNDIELMKLVGISVTPNDADYHAKKYANYICHENGGHGAFREAVNLILKFKFSKKINWY